MTGEDAMENERAALLAPGRLSALLALGLTGHHPLFDRDAILEAFEVADRPVAREDAGAVGQALLAICKEPLAISRATVATLPRDARLSLIRLYFRLLDRADEERRALH
jgi:hypothetical protein